MKNRICLVVIFALAHLVLVSCSKKETVDTDPLAEVKLEVYDSVIVDVLQELMILDYNSSSDSYLMIDRKGSKLMLVNGQGEVLATPDIIGEGPDQLQMLWEGRFMGKDQYIFKTLSNNMDLYVFDRDFKRVKLVPGPAVGLNALFISFYRQTFNVFEEGGKTYLLGEEVNAYNPGEINTSKNESDFYDLVNTGYFYDLDQDSITYFSLYSEDWTPRKTGRWVGQSFPFLSFNPDSKQVAVLPPLGDQVFIYKLVDRGIEPLHTIELKHPERNQRIPDPSGESLLYPAFGDIKSFGEYQLILFYTAVPEDVFNEFRSKGEDYQQDPEFRKMLTQYRKPRYMITKDGHQVGIVNELPVRGNVNFATSDGTLLIKASNDETEERDYNLFYKVRLVE